MDHYLEQPAGTGRLVACSKCAQCYGFGILCLFIPWYNTFSSNLKINSSFNFTGKKGKLVSPPFYVGIEMGDSYLDPGSEMNFYGSEPATLIATVEHSFIILQFRLLAK
jgi:hypothetical protein